MPNYKYFNTYPQWTPKRTTLQTSQRTFPIDPPKNPKNKPILSNSKPIIYPFQLVLLLFQQKSPHQHLIKYLLFKVHVFWEGHKILRNLHLSNFWLQYIQSKARWRFRKKFWPSQNIWTLSTKTRSLHLTS